MDEALVLAKYAKSEINSVDEIIDLQTEKYIELQKKIGNHKSILLRTSQVMQKLKEATKIRKILIYIFLIFLTFFCLLFIIKYL